MECATCGGTPEALCGGCRNFAYCGIQCAQKHWTLTHQWQCIGGKRDRKDTPPLVTKWDRNADTLGIKATGRDPAVTLFVAMEPESRTRLLLISYLDPISQPLERFLEKYFLKVRYNVHTAWRMFLELPTDKRDRRAALTRLVRFLEEDMRLDVDLEDLAWFPLETPKPVEEERQQMADNSTAPTILE